MKYIDFHSHTFYSDGSDSPGSLIRAVKTKGVDSLAITDHDIMAGYYKGIEEAKKWNLRLIPGVEVSTRKYHILGLNVDPDNSDFQKFLEKIQGLQKEVCSERIDALKKHGIPINMEKLTSTYPKSRVGKWNIILAMLQDDECRKYLEKNTPGLTPHETLEFYVGKNGIAAKTRVEDVHSKDAIDQIHNAKGIAVVAHPFKQAKHTSELDALVKNGLDGLEVQPNYGEKNYAFIEYAAKNGLYMTYGSDFHGAGFNRPLLGRGVNEMADEPLEAMLNKWR